MPRFGTLALATALAALAVSPVSAALFFVFDPPNAKAGDLVTVRLGGTPAGFTAADRQRPFQKPLRLYLVPAAVAGRIHSPLDRRLHFVGVVTPDARGRGAVSFQLPPVATGEYTLARWCRTCSSGRTFVVVPGGTQTGLPEAERTLLRAELPDARETCPVTIPSRSTAPPGLERRPYWLTNGFLWTALPPEGVLRGRVAPDGSVSTKWLWFAARVDGDLRVRLERLDAPSAAVDAQTVRGWVEGFRGSATWAARMRFPAAGCWRISGRVADVTLSYVVAVTREP